MLTDAQLEHYRDRGYVVPDFRLPESVLEDLRADQARLVARHPELRQYCPNLLHYDLRFLEVARTPEIVAMVSQILGPDLALWNSSLFAKPAADGKRTHTGKGVRSRRPLVAHALPHERRRSLR